MFTSRFKCDSSDIVHETYAGLKTFLHHMTAYLKKRYILRNFSRRNGWKTFGQKTLVFLLHVIYVRVFAHI